MFKNMKLGLKMGIGFGVVIILVGIVGGLSILNMLKIQKDSIKLKDEYVPEVAIVNQIERSSLQTMYAMRGYSLNFDEDFYQDAEQGLAAVYEALKAAENHASTYTDLKALNEGVVKARKEVDLYKSLAEDTKTEIDLIMGFRDNADSAATIFMENCNNYLESQNLAMEREIQNNASQAALSARLKKITLINTIIDLGNALRVANFKGQLFNDAEGMQKALSNFAEVDSVLREIRAITAQQVNIKQLEEIERTGALYEGAMESIIKSYSNLNLISGERGEAAEQVLTVAQEVAGVGIETTQSIADGAVNTIRASVMIIIVGVIVSLVIALIVAVFLTRIITAALIKGVEFAQKLATGDLTAQLDVVQKDELGILAEALRNMRDKLAEVVGTVITGAEQIATASEELAEGNQDLSNRTEQQASALEETSSAIEEMNASIKSNADNTTAADNLAREAVSKADTGELTISKMINSMDEINSSSSQIAAIIEVITNIAFQTNLLALNASIEAARAGEQGKGFAVVAVEVRKLAKRSDKAANEITSIIKNSNARVTEGVEIANEAGAMLKEINESVKKVTALVGEIAAASQEQLTSADQIDQTLGSLDENTQKNAALVEEAASATEELSAQAQELSSAINYFTISRTQASKTKKESKK